MCSMLHFQNEGEVMKRSLWVIVLLFLCASPVYAVPTLVLSGAAGGNGSTAVLSIPNTCGSAAPSLLIIAVTMGYTHPNIPTPYDSKGNNWLPLTTGGNAAVSYTFTKLFYAVSPSCTGVGVNHNFQLDGAAGSSPTLMVAGFTGTAGSSPFYTQTTGYDKGTTAGTTLSLGGVSTSASDELVITAIGAYYPGAPGVAGSSLPVPTATSYTTITPTILKRTAVNYASVLAYKVQTSAGTVTDPQWTNGAQNWYSGVLATFKAGSGGGGGTSPASINVSTVPGIAGLGTVGSPWTGWDTAISWAANTAYSFAPGNYAYTTAPNWGKGGIVLNGSGSGVTTLMHTGTGVITALTGTTNASSATTITGSNTLFTTQLELSDLISVSSAPATYRRITAITSDTSLTVDGALGNGTAQQMINLKRNRAVNFDGGPSAGSTCSAPRMQGFRITGTAATTDGVYIRSCFRAQFEDILVQNVTAAGLHTVGTGLNTYRNFRVSVNEPGQTITPLYGVLTAAVVGGFTTSVDLYENLMVEGVSSIGIYLKGAYGVKFIGGTSESNGVGMQIDPEVFLVSVDGMDFEQNAGNGLVIYGSFNTIEKGLVSDPIVIAGGSAIANTVRDLSATANISVTNGFNNLENITLSADTKENAALLLTIGQNQKHSTRVNNIWAYGQSDGQTMPFVHSMTFVGLGAPPSGVPALYCSDCKEEDPCAAAGDGAWAKRMGSPARWVCLP